MSHHSQQAATTIVATLLARGITDIVLSPGSRSAPLAYACWEVRDRLRLHVRIDERSAGFTALGLAKASGRLVAVITTSGTAVGNLLPAVLEAWHAQVPLMVISADRPATMINTGANQTTQQVGIFADHVRGAARINAVDNKPNAWAYGVDRLTGLAVGVRGSVPGPVHLNVEFCDPLTPADPLPGEVQLPELDAPPTRNPTRIAAGPRSVIVAGDLPVRAGHELATQAEQAGIPLLAEPSSNARHGATAISSYRLLLDAGIADEVEHVIMVGHPTLSRPVQRLLGRDDIELTVVAPHPEWIDPQQCASRVVSAVEFVGPSSQDHLARWQGADQRLMQQLRIEQGPLTTARAVVASLDSGDQLVLGSSNPIRDVDLVEFSQAAQVYANRGLAGIDGTVSLAIAVALAHPLAPTTAFLGDLTFIHDSNGLILGPDEPRPERLRIVVANDDGGSIFSTLEYANPTYSESFERLFGTPHCTDLGALARAAKVDHHRVDDHDQLCAHLDREVAGIEVVEVVTDRADRAAAIVRHQQWAQDAVS